MAQIQWYRIGWLYSSRFLADRRFLMIWSGCSLQNSRSAVDGMPTASITCSPMHGVLRPFERVLSLGWLDRAMNVATFASNMVHLVRVAGGHMLSPSQLSPKRCLRREAPQHPACSIQHSTFVSNAHVYDLVCAVLRSLQSRMRATHIPVSMNQGNTRAFHRQNALESTDVGLGAGALSTWTS